MDANSKEAIQERFRVYLKTYRESKGLTQQHLAKKFGYAESHIKKFEGKDSNNRLITSLEFMENLASLQKISLIDFLCYLLDAPTAGSSAKIVKHIPWHILPAFLEDNHNLADNLLSQGGLKESIDLAFKIINLRANDKMFLCEMVDRFSDRVSIPNRLAKGKAK